jgi:hypothetical protein
MGRVLMASHSRYSGEERRHHKVFVTHHTEYHVRAGQVVAVRPRGSKDWLGAHTALRMKVQGYIVPGTMLPQAGLPRPGQQMYLATPDNDVVTSPIVAIVRPPKNTVADYPPA